MNFDTLTGIMYSFQSVIFGDYGPENTIATQCTTSTPKHISTQHPFPFPTSLSPSVTSPNVTTTFHPRQNAVAGPSNISNDNRSSERRRHTVSAGSRGSPPTYGQTIARDMLTSSRAPLVSLDIPPPVYPSDAERLETSAIAPSPSCSILPISATIDFIRTVPPAGGHTIPDSSSPLEAASSSSVSVQHISSQDAANNIVETGVSVASSVLQTLSTSQSATISTASRPRLGRGFSDETVIALEAYYPDAPDSVRRRMSTGYANYPGSYGGYGGMSESQSRRTVPFDEEDGDPELPTYVEEDKLASSRMVQLLQGSGTEARGDSVLRESQSLQ